MAEVGYNSLRSGSEYIYDFFCEVCVDDNKHVEACGYCVDCEEYLCEECYTAHKRPRLTRHHVLKDKSNMPKDTPMSTDRVNKTIVTRCKSHSANLVEFYCNSHDVFGCSTCFATVHKHCQTVEYILETSGHNLDSQYYEKFLFNLKTMKDNAEDIIKRTSSNGASVKKCYSDFVAAIKQTKEDLIKVLNEAEGSMVSLARKLCSEDEGKIKNLATECKDASTRIDKISSEIERLKSSKRVCQLYIKMKEIAGEINTIGENIRSYQERNIVRMYRFEPNNDIENLMRVPDVLGKLFNLTKKVEHTTSDFPSNSMESKDDDTQSSSTVVPSNLSAIKYADAKPTTPVVSSDPMALTDNYEHPTILVVPNNQMASKDANAQPTTPIVSSNQMALKHADAQPTTPIVSSNLLAIKYTDAKPTHMVVRSDPMALTDANAHPTSLVVSSNKMASKDADAQPTTLIVSSNHMTSKDANAQPATPFISVVTDINVSSSSDTKACSISGSAVLPNNKLVLVDQSNDKVKLVNIKDTKLISEFKLPSWPCDITAVSQNKVAVTLTDSCQILLLDVKDRIHKDREIQVGVGCRGVAYIQDRLVVLYAYFHISPHLNIIDLQGNVIRIINIGRKLLTSPWYVCVSNDGETIYVSDFGRHTVTSLTLQGDVKSVYQDKELSGPRGVCTDQNGNVYVCGYGSRNVHMITANCKKIKVIQTLADRLDYSVQSVSHCLGTNKLFIGLDGNNIVKVLKLS